ncbi:MAG: hypothetical protein K0U45_08095 [Alphaproteobacteria bacterium]|nr:hypothetical protein [Alphaproteobacteria bacterium]
MLICNNINHTTHHADGSYHHLEIPHLKASPNVPLIIDGDDDDGKQILINILSGLSFAQGADIKLFSSSPFALSLAHRHQTIGYFGDKDNFKPLWSVRDNLDLFAGGTLNEILCRNLFEFFELDYITFIDKEYGTLDDETQMVLRAIGCFIAEPRAYFLHLPFCVLPTHFHLVLCELLTQQQDNIVVITHQKGHFLPLEGDKYSLYDGKLWHQGKLVQSDTTYLDKQTPASPNIVQKNSDLALENLVEQFPLPEHKQQMVEQHLDDFASDDFELDSFALDSFAGGWQQPNQPDDQSNVFAKFLSPIDDDIPIKKPDIVSSELPQQNNFLEISLPQSDSSNIVAENSDQINDEPSDEPSDEPNNEITYQENDTSNDAISDEANDININDTILSASDIQTDELADEALEMVDVAPEISPYHNPMLEQDSFPEIAEQETGEQETAAITQINDELPQKIIVQEIMETLPPEIIEQEKDDELPQETIASTTITQQTTETIITEETVEITQETIITEGTVEIIQADDEAPIETIIEETIIEETISEIVLQETTEATITEETAEEETEEAISEIEAQQPDEVPDERIVTEQSDVFQHNKQKKFAYQPLDDDDTEIFQPTPLHFNHESFIPPHSDHPNIIAKFEQHLHHVPEIGRVFQHELGYQQPVISDDLRLRDEEMKHDKTMGDDDNYPK